MTVTLQAVPSHTTAPAQTVSVSSGQATHVDFAVVRFGTIAGEVRDNANHRLVDGAGNPLRVTVGVYVGGVRITSAQTDLTGHYVVEGPAGNAILLGDGVEGWDAPAGAAVTFATGTSSAGAGPTLVYLHWGRIAGFVRDPAGTGVAGIVVRTSTGRTSTTNAAGAYSISAPHGSYVVSIDRAPNIVTPTGSTPAGASSCPRAGKFG